MPGTTQIQVCFGNPAIIELHGEIDFAHADQIRVAARQVVSSGQSELYVDCAGVEFLDSSGIAALIDAAKTAQAVGGSVHLIYVPEQVAHVFYIAGLESLFVIDKTEENRRTEYEYQSPGPQRSTFSVSARPEVVADVRRQVALLARKLPFTDQDIEDIKLAVGEATSNAIRHGSPLGECNRITIRCEQIGDAFVVEICDEGPGFDLESKTCKSPDQFAECGRGLFFMKQLMDRVSARNAPGAVVRLEKRIRPTGERN